LTHQTGEGVSYGVFSFIEEEEIRSLVAKSKQGRELDWRP
jgi:hypothetical protein